MLEMVRGVAALGLEVCCTLGMLSAAQAARLAEAGLTAYNHNLDTGPEFYDRIITTRTYDGPAGHPAATSATPASPSAAAASSAWASRSTIAAPCCACWPALDPHPECVPINALVRGRRHAARRRGPQSTPSRWRA